jgi:VIT1/CCC1 family predicted Fe2+/Mn2+ transporter
MVSMAIGSYLGTRSERSLHQAIVAREEWEMADHPDEEIQEMEAIYRGYGFSAEETAVILRALVRDPRLWLTLMVRDEHGVLLEAGDSPAYNAFLMAAAVLAGSVPPLVPVLIAGTAFRAEPAVFAMAGLSAVALGWVTARLTASRPWVTAGTFLIWTAIAMLLGSAMGFALGHL